MGHGFRHLEFWRYCQSAFGCLILHGETNIKPVLKLINQIWGLDFHIFEPREPEDNEMYDTRIVIHQHEWFGPFPISYKEIADEETQEAILGIMSAVPPEKMKPFARVGEREISDPDKAFVLKIMKLDPRDRPTATELLQDEWFTERSERTVGWYSKEKWQKMQQQHQENEQGSAVSSEMANCPQKSPDLVRLKGQ